MTKLALSFLILFSSMAFAQPPYPPPSQPDYGPGYTRYWVDSGFHKAPKVVKDDLQINVNHRYVNEIVLRGDNATVDISSALVYLSGGQILELRQLLGNLPKNREFRTRLDYYNSLRVSRIVLRISSPQVIGPSGKVQVLLGMAQ